MFLKSILGPNSLLALERALRILWLDSRALEPVQLDLHQHAVVKKPLNAPSYRAISGRGWSILGGWRFHCDQPLLPESCEGIELTEDTSGSTGLGEGEEWRVKGVSGYFKVAASNFRSTLSFQ
jgi:hypothetical protein